MLINGPVLGQRLMRGSAGAPYTAGVGAQPCSRPGQETRDAQTALSLSRWTNVLGEDLQTDGVSQTTGRKFHFQTSSEFFTDSLYSKYISLRK